MPGQLRQQGILLARQRDLHSLQGHFAKGEIHHQRPEDCHHFATTGLRHLTQQRAHPGQEFLNAERLGHVVIGAAIQRVDLLHLTGPHRQHQHRHRAPLAQLAQHLLAVHVGQAQVEHHQVGLGQRGLGQAFAAGGGFDHLVALGTEADAQELADLWFIVDDQQGGGLAHGVSLSASGCWGSGKHRVMQVPWPSMPSPTRICPP